MYKANFDLSVNLDGGETCSKQLERLRHRGVAAREAAGEVEHSMEIEIRVELSVGQDQ